MLILSRKVDQQIIIDGPATIVVTGIRQCGENSRVVIGIDAPESTTVLRPDAKVRFPKHLVGIDPDATDALLRRDGQIPITADEVRRRIASGESIADIGEALDCEDGQIQRCCKSTSEVPAASLAPEYRLRQRMADGEPLCQIEADMDAEDNQ